MFLDLLRRRNPALLDAAAHLHASGELPANTYAIDLDAVGRNATAFAAQAARHGLAVFAMTKQIGRNPDVSAALVRAGIAEAVAVDLQCALAASAGGLRIGNIGHLVQIPRHDAGTAAALTPRYWTVFDDEKAREAGDAARRLGRVQDVLLRVAAPGDIFYTGHEGGYPADEVVAAADRVDAIDGVRVAGVTSFPATLFDEATGTAVATPNRATLARAAAALASSGRTDVQVNAPGTTSAAILGKLAADGATQVEPGHGLTGTTPLHAVRDLVEEPAIVYVSEVSHLWDSRAYVFGGGLYVDPVLGDAATAALVVPPGGDARAAGAPLPVEMPAPAAIDYYARVPVPDDRHVRVGDTVLFGFRPQVFVTRALTAAIAGVGSGTPRVVGLWAADGSAPLALGSGVAR